MGRARHFGTGFSSHSHTNKQKKASGKFRGGRRIQAACIEGLEPRFLLSTTITGSNSTTINLKDNNFAPYNGVANPYPSTINLSGFQAGQTVASASVTINDINWQTFISGNYQSYAEDFKALLEGPGGESLVLMSTCGPSFATNPGFNNITLTFADSAASSFGQFQSFATTGSLTSKPVDFSDTGYSSTDSAAFVSPAPSNFKQPAPTGSETFASVFGGQAPNGNWQLFLSTDGADSDSTGTVSGWSLSVTAGSVSATTTALTTSLNPSFTSSPNNSTTLTAAVTSSGTPVTEGTVTFTDTTTNTVLASNVPVGTSGASAGVATTTAAFTTEGNHVIKAVYNGDSNYNTSNNSVTQTVNNHTTINGNTFTNPGTIKIADNVASPGGVATPYLSHLSLTLEKVNYYNVISGTQEAYFQDLKAMLVAPDGQAYVFISDDGPNTGAVGVQNVTVTFDDAAFYTIPSSVALGSANSTVTSKPIDYSSTNNNPDAGAFPTPAPQSNYKSASPEGSDTFSSAFNGQSPDGTWSLYVVVDRGDSGSTGTISGWNLNITSVGTSATTTSVAAASSQIFTGGASSSTTLTATVSSGGNPVTSGTVTFTDTTTNTVLASGVALNGSGQASTPFSSTSEGVFNIQASYSGNSTYNISTGSTTVEVDDHTTISGNSYINTGALTLRDNTLSPGGVASPYPSHVFVSGLTNTISHLSVSLNGVSFIYSQDIQALLVGPGGQNFILIGDVGPSSGTTGVSNVTLTIDDSAASTLAQNSVWGAPNSSVASKPVEYSSVSFASPAPAGPYNENNPQLSNNPTLGSIFDGTSPDGTWSLYVTTNTGESGATGSIAGGWSLNLTVPAAVTAGPTPQTVTAGQTATFTSAANGSPAPTVQWQVSTDGGKTFNNISGRGTTAPTYSFTVSATQANNQYRAVYDGSASLTTNAAALTVLLPEISTGVGAHYNLSGPPGAQVVDVTAGTVTLIGDLSKDVTNCTLNIENGASAVLSSDEHIGALQLVGTGMLNAANRALYINYGTGSDPISTIAGYLKTGYNHGAWNGAGIFSTSAAANSGYTLGYADGADGVVSGLSSGQIEIKYTLYGDINLDGAVNGTDFSLLAADFGQSVTGWDRGDLNFDGAVNGTDFSLLAQNFGKTAAGAATLPPATPAAAPASSQNPTALVATNSSQKPLVIQKVNPVLKSVPISSVSRKRQRHS
jgi:hypothetical protein